MNNTRQFFDAYRHIARLTSSEAVINLMFPGEPDSMKEHFMRKWEEAKGNLYVFYFMLDLPNQKKVEETMENVAWGITNVVYNEDNLPAKGQKVKVSHGGEVWYDAYFTTYNSKGKRQFGVVLEEAHLNYVYAYTSYFEHMRKPLDN